MKTTTSFACALALVATGALAAPQQGSPPAAAQPQQSTQGTAAQPADRGSPTERQRDGTGLDAEAQQERSDPTGGSPVGSSVTPIAFEAADGNNDGYITPDELVVDHDLRVRFGEFDRNGDGRLSPEELQRYR